MPLRRWLAGMYWRLWQDVSRELAELVSNQFASPAKVHELQTERLTRLVVHAATKVPYYRGLLTDAGVLQSGGTVDVNRLGDVPLLDKDVIRTQFERLKSEDLVRRQWKYNTSGGSTGEPIRFIQDEQYNKWSSAVKVLFDQWSSYVAGMRRVKLWGSERDLFVGSETLKVRLGRWIRNELWLNSFRMTKDDMRRYVERINAFRPQQILAYVESIYELARFAEREGLEVRPPGAIMTSAGTLHPHMRETIERVFQAPVFNRYGSREVGDIACECEAHEGLHVSPLTHYVEILRSDGSPTEPGEVGEVVVTSLVNYAMPLIRYRIGDLAAWHTTSCSCGRGWPLLQEVTGRLTEVFRRRDGGIVVPEYLIHLVGVVLYRAHYRKFQVVQEDYDAIRVRIVPSDPKFRPSNVQDELAEIAAKLRLVMGEECRIDFSFEDEIDPGPSGKHSYTLSKVAR